MMKRFLIGLTFASAFMMGGLAISDTAEARQRWGGRSYSSGYYALSRAYYGRPYSSYYRSYYAPSYYSYPRSYSRGYYPRSYSRGYYGYPSNNYYGGSRSGVSFSFGF